jgi:hypothetical protein
VKEGGMSIEIHVLSDRKLASIGVWQQAIAAEAFALVLDPEVDFEKASGFVPASLSGRQSGFEMYHDDAAELMETYADTPGLVFDHAWKHALSFRWGSLDHEGISAFMAATAYARATGGVVFDPQEGALIAPDRSKELAQRWAAQAAIK